MIADPRELWQEEFSERFEKNFKVASIGNSLGKQVRHQEVQLFHPGR